MNLFEVAAVLTLNSRQYQKGLNDAQKETHSFASGIGGALTGIGKGFETIGKVGAASFAAIGVSVAALAAGTVTVGKKLWSLSNEIASAGDEIDKTSQKIGISAESYQQWSYVFERSGANIGNLQVGMKTLSSVITSAAAGSSAAADKLKAVGLSVKDLADKSQDEQLSMVVAALQNMEAGAARTAAATSLLGRSATDMAAVLNMTAEETEALKNEAIEYGMVMSDDAVKASAAFEDSLTKLKNTVKGVKTRLVSDLLPGITLLADGFASLLADKQSAEEELNSGVDSLVDSLEDILPKAVDVLSKIGSAVVAKAPDVLMALGSSLVDAIPTAIDAGGKLIDGLIRGFGANQDKIISATTTAIKTILSKISSSLPSVIRAGGELLNSLAEGIKDSTPSILASAKEIIIELVETLTSTNAITTLLDTGTFVVIEIAKALTDPESMNRIAEAAGDILVQLATGLGDSIGVILAAAPEIIHNLVIGLTNSFNTLVAAGGNALNEFLEGISSSFDSNTAIVLISEIANLIASIFTIPILGIDTSSLVDMFIQGIKEGNWEDLVEFMGELGERLDPTAKLSREKMDETLAWLEEEIGRSGGGTHTSSSGVTHGGRGGFDNDEDELGPNWARWANTTGRQRVDGGEAVGVLVDAVTQLKNVLLENVQEGNIDLDEWNELSAKINEGLITSVEELQEANDKIVAAVKDDGTFKGKTEDGVPLNLTGIRVDAKDLAEAMEKVVLETKSDENISEIHEAVTKYLPQYAETITTDSTNLSEVMSLMTMYLPYIPQLAALKIVLDSGALVGQIAPMVNQSLGDQAGLDERGGT